MMHRNLIERGLERLMISIASTALPPVANIGSIVIAFATKSITWKRLWIDVVEGARMSAAVLILLIGAKVFLRFITASGLATYLTNFIIGLDVSKYVILFFVFIIYADRKLHWFDKVK